MTPAEIRADHVGSLVRPEKLLAAAPMRSDPAAHADLRALEDEAILAVIDRQRSLGLSVVTDGEFCRSAFATGFMDAVDGFVPGLPRALAWHGGTGEEESSPNARVVAAPLVARRRIAETEVAFLHVHARGRAVQGGPAQPADAAGGRLGARGHRPGLSPARGPRRGRRGDPCGRGRAPVRRGPALPAGGRPALHVLGRRDAARQDGRRRHRPGLCLLRTAIAGDNAIIDATRPETVTGVHLCRGNSMGRWLAEGGYDAVAETLFTGLHCDRLLLEYDDERSGGFAPLRFVPEDKTVVLGLVSTKTPRLESRDTLLARIEEASAVVPIERLALSPQCGFGSAGRGPLTEDEQWRKLELVASIAAEVWG
jgi:5-methyltetrahydropteroyltriglutamate--homocysteine methyltransferase